MLALSDEELVRRCQIELPDETSSYEILLQRYSTQVFNRIYQLVGNREEAEDITQEVFVKVYYNLKKFEQPGAFLGWLYRIATNTALNSLQKRKSRPVKADSSPKSAQKAGFRENEVGQDFQEFRSGVVSDPEEIYAQAELRNCINEVFKTMEREQASLLVMRDIDNLSYDEVAGAMGVGLSAIKMRIFRARGAFQELFKKLCSSWASHLQASSRVSTNKNEPKTSAAPKLGGGEI